MALASETVRDRVLKERQPISDQMGAWMAASTLESHLITEDLTQEKAKLLKRMAQDLVDWLEGQA